jgi:hypothetical protein
MAKLLMAVTALRRDNDKGPTFDTPVSLAMTRKTVAL